MFPPVNPNTSQLTVHDLMDAVIKCCDEVLSSTVTHKTLNCAAQSDDVLPA